MGKVEMVSVQSAGERLYCLAAIVMRGQFEMVIGSSASTTTTAEASDVLVGEHKKLIQNVNSWLKTEGLWDTLSTKEQALLSKPPGTWDERDELDASWRTEAAAVIAWSLGMVDTVPAYDQSFSDADLLKATGGMLKPVRRKIMAMKLRPADEIAKARDVVELWLWRARTTMLKKDPQQYKPPKGLSFDRIVRITAAKAHGDGLFKAIDGDFPACGKAYRDLDDEQWSLMRSIASERLWGLNWMCGYESDWDEVPLGT